MPLKLIGVIVLLIFVTIFSGVNIDHKCDISFVFYTFKSVPVFMTVIISFVAGAILVLPFTFGNRKKKKNEKSAAKNPNEITNSAPDKDSKTLFDFKIKREAKNSKENKPKIPFFKKKKEEPPCSETKEQKNEPPETAAPSPSDEGSGTKSDSSAGSEESET